MITMVMMIIEKKMQELIETSRKNGNMQQNYTWRFYGDRDQMLTHIISECN